MMHGTYNIKIKKKTEDHVFPYNKGTIHTESMKYPLTHSFIHSSVHSPSNHTSFFLVSNVPHIFSNTISPFFTT